MQFLYAHHISKVSSNIVEKNMLYSIDKIDELYLCLLNLMIRLRQMAAERLSFIKKNKIEEKNDRFLYQLASNKVIEILSKNIFLSDFNSKNNQLSWNFHKNYLELFFRDSKKNFVVSSEKTLEKDFISDKNFILNFYKNHIELNSNLAKWALEGYFTWAEDLPIAHNMVINTLSFIKENTKEDLRLYKVYKDDLDKEFLLELYKQTLLYKDQFNHWINKASHQWEIGRIAPLDLIILQMALCEFVYFPTIPPKVSMNEYIELAKVYSGQKSKLFINGVLDKLFGQLTKENKIIKTGKGLL